MYLDLDDYFSNWIALLFIIWFLLHKFNIHYQWFNLIDCCRLIFYGVILLLFYHNFPKLNFNLSLIIFILITHYIPLYYLKNYTKLKSDKYSFLLLLVLIIIYLSYLCYQKINVVELYLEEAEYRWPLLWNKLTTF